MKCIVCGSGRFGFLYTLRDISFNKPGKWSFVQCKECGHGFINPKPSNKDLRLFYESLYNDEKSQDMVHLGESSFDKMLQKNRADLVSKHAKGNVRSILDVGCGMGFSLKELARRFPEAEAIGIDMAPEAVQNASKLDGLKIHRKVINELDLSANSLDVVTMNHVLEHLSNPVTELSIVHRLLAPGGILLIEIPIMDGWCRRTFKSWWFGHLPPQHLHLFKSNSMSRFLGDLGFDFLEQRRSGYPLVFFISIIIYIRKQFGSYSPFKTNPLIRLPITLLGLIFLPLAFLLDFTLTPLLNFRHGDICTYVFRKGVDSSGSEP